MSDDEREVFEGYANLAKMFARNAAPTIKCPCGDQDFALNMKESLDPYCVTMALEPMPGRAMDAKVIGGQIRNMARLFESIGKEYDHETQCVLMGVTVAESMRTEIRMAFIPKVRRSSEEHPMNETGTDAPTGGGNS